MQIIDKKKEKESEDSYKMKYPETYRLELVRSKLQILYKTDFDEEYLLNNLIRLNLKQEGKKIGFSITYIIPSEFGNIRTEYEIGDSNKLYSEKRFNKGYFYLAKCVDKFFTVLDSGIDAVVNVAGPAAEEVKNYVTFINKLDTATEIVIESLPSIVKNFY